MLESYTLYPQPLHKSYILNFVKYIQKLMDNPLLHACQYSNQAAQAEMELSNSTRINDYFD